MRKLIGTTLTALLMALLLTVAAPAAHADPPTDGTAQCPAILQLGCNAVDATVGTVENKVIDPVVGTAQDAAGAVGGAIDFVKNPLGYLAAAVQGAAIWFMGQVALLAYAATEPDLSASWWVKTYVASLTIAVLLLGFVLLVEIVQCARRKISGDDLIETLSIWVPAFFAGVLFGPALAQFMIDGLGALATGIVHYLPGYSGGDAFKSISDAAGNSSWIGPVSDAQGVVQAILALLVGIGVLIAAVVVFVSLCLQAVIVYLASAVFAVGWVFIISNRHRADAWRIPRLILGILAGKALLFILLGAGLSIATAMTAIQGDGATRDMALVVMGISAMLIAAFAPMILLRHAPVIPGTGTSRHSGEMAGAIGGGVRRSATDGKNITTVAKSGHGKLSALAAARSERKSGAPPGAAAGPGRVIDAPIPVSGTSKAGGKAAPRVDPRSSSAAGAGTTSPKSADPRTTPPPAKGSTPSGPAAAPAGSSGSTTGRSNGSASNAGTAGSGAASTPKAAQAPGQRASTPPASGAGPKTAASAGSRLSGSVQSNVVADHDYRLPTEPPAEESG